MGSHFAKYEHPQIGSNVTLVIVDKSYALYEQQPSKNVSSSRAMQNKAKQILSIFT